MPRFLHMLSEPKRLAGLVTVATVLWSFQLQPQAPAAWRWSVAGLFVLLLLGHQLLPAPRLRDAALWLQAAAALALVWLEPAIGTAPVLLVVVVAQVASLWEPRRVLALALLANLGTFLVLSTAGFKRALLTTLIYAGFHAFAALTAHYARTTEIARAALARVNADLLATRALLADSARDAERLRLARELHDVAGHKLTAMRINLRLLLADPANNPVNWQWVAGCGNDPAPYFRIFNPVLQGEKFDPDGAYVRRWVPELAAMPDRFIHNPWDAPKAMLAEAGVELGRTYPKPMVDHKRARARALDALRRYRDAL